MENDIELQDSQNLDSEQVADETPDVSEDDAGESEIDASKLQETNKRLYERAKKAEAELKTLKSHVKPQTDVPPDVREELQRIRLESKGFSEKQINLVMKLGGVKALENEEVKIAVEAIGEREKQSQAQAESTVQSKTEKKYSEEYLRKLSSAEILKLIQEGKIK